MPNNHGGPRTPANPAPVSGPGSLSRRTDGGPAKPAYVNGLPYGEGQDFYDLQTSAPLGAPNAATPRMKSGASSQGGAPSPTPLFAPTARPDEPVTAGAPFGPGSGPSPMGQQASSLQQSLRKMVASDDSGDAMRLLAIVERLGW